MTELTTSIAGIQHPLQQSIFELLVLVVQQHRLAPFVLSSQGPVVRQGFERRLRSCLLIFTSIVWLCDSRMQSQTQRWRLEDDESNSTLRLRLQAVLAAHYQPWQLVQACCWRNLLRREVPG